MNGYERKEKQDALVVIGCMVASVVLIIALIASYF